MPRASSCDNRTLNPHFQNVCGRQHSFSFSFSVFSGLSYIFWRFEEKYSGCGCLHIRGSHEFRKKPRSNSQTTNRGFAVAVLDHSKSDLSKTTASLHERGETSEHGRLVRLSEIDACEPACRPFAKCRKADGDFNDARRVGSPSVMWQAGRHGLGRSSRFRLTLPMFSSRFRRFTID